MALEPRDGGGLDAPLAEINVTPFVDVMLVLLVIFMITAPMLATGMRVNLPRATTAQPLNPAEPLIVVIGKDGKLFVGAEATTREELVATLKARLTPDDARPVQIKGDRETPYGDVVAVLDLLSAGGLARIAIATERPKPAPPRPEP
jgi:biopolymer transport protein ExbD